MSSSIPKIRDDVLRAQLVNVGHVPDSIMVAYNKYTDENIRFLRSFENPDVIRIQYSSLFENADETDIDEAQRLITHDMNKVLNLTNHNSPFIAFHKNKDEVVQAPVIGRNHYISIDIHRKDRDFHKHRNESPESYDDVVDKDEVDKDEAFQDKVKISDVVDENLKKIKKAYRENNNETEDKKLLRKNIYILGELTLKYPIHLAVIDREDWFNVCLSLVKHIISINATHLKAASCKWIGYHIYGVNTNYDATPHLQEDHHLSCQNMTDGLLNNTRHQIINMVNNMRTFTECGVSCAVIDDEFSMALMQEEYVNKVMKTVSVEIDSIFNEYQNEITKRFPLMSAPYCMVTGVHRRGKRVFIGVSVSMAMECIDDQMISDVIHSEMVKKVNEIYRGLITSLTKLGRSTNPILGSSCVRSKTNFFDDDDSNNQFYKKFSS